MTNSNENKDPKNFMGKFYVLKREYKKLENKQTRENVIMYSFIFLFIISSLALVLSTIRCNDLIKKNKMLQAQNTELSDEIEVYFDTSLHFADMAIKMDESNAELKGMLEQAEKDMEIYRTREDLLNKYEYALFEPNKKRTDLTYEQIISLQDYCEEKGYTTEMVSLVLAIAMKESTCHEKAVNGESGASGYGQFLESTGRFVYTKLQGHNSYTLDDALDGDKSLKMVSDYMAYLYEYHGNSMEKAMISYRGCYDEPYMKKIDEYLGKNNLSLNTIKILKDK